MKWAWHLPVDWFIDNISRTEELQVPAQHPHHSGYFAKHPFPVQKTSNMLKGISRTTRRTTLQPDLSLSETWQTSISPA